MGRNECIMDYLPSVDVQATEGLMGKILLCMYAREAYVSCAFTCLSTSNACWLIYNSACNHGTAATMMMWSHNATMKTTTTRHSWPVPWQHNDNDNVATIMQQ